MIEPKYHYNEDAERKEGGDGGEGICRRYARLFG